MKLALFTLILVMGMIPAFAQSPSITFDIDEEQFKPGEIVDLKGSVDKEFANRPVAVEVKDGEGNVILIRTVTPDSDGNFVLKFKVPSTAKVGDFDIIANIEVEGEPVSESKTVETESKPAAQPSSGKGGGCLIATATYGSELAPQVQMLREIRDNSILKTASGTSFMTGFNEFYYSFSPAIADLERQNPVFKETVKIAITPLIISLSILNFVDIDSEEEMLGYGIGIIVLNIGMYFAAPAIVIINLRKENEE